MTDGQRVLGNRRSSASRDGQRGWCVAERRSTSERSLTERAPSFARRAQPNGRGRWALGLVLAAAMLLAACGESGGEAERLNQEGNRDFRAGDYQAALDTYLRAEAERPDLTEIAYNAGSALHRLGQYDRAVREAQKAAAQGSNETRFRAYYAIGNDYAKQEKWREAYDSYRNALILDPTDQDAKYNLEVAWRHLQQQEDQQAKQQPPQGQPEDGNGQGQPNQPGQGQPQAGDPSQGGQGQGNPQAQPGQATQGQPGGGQGTPQPGQTRSGQQTDAAAAEQQLKDALAQFERNVSVDEALRILDLLAEQQRQQRQQIPGPPPGSNIKDQ